MAATLEASVAPTVVVFTARDVYNLLIETVLVLDVRHEEDIARDGQLAGALPFVASSDALSELAASAHSFGAETAHTVVVAGASDSWPDGSDPNTTAAVGWLCGAYRAYSRRGAALRTVGVLSRARLAELLARAPSLARGHSLSDHVHPSEILPGELYLSSSLPATDGPVLAALGITHVVNCTRDLPCEPRGNARARACADVALCYHRAAIDDDEREELGPHLADALAFVTSALAAGGRVLVHCEAGRSRSPSFVMAFLVEHRAMSLDAAWRLVVSCRPLVRPNPAFERQLRARYERID